MGLSPRPAPTKRSKGHTGDKIPMSGSRHISRFCAIWEAYDRTEKNVGVSPTDQSDTGGGSGTDGARRAGRLV